MNRKQKLLKSGRIERSDLDGIGERFRYRGRGAISNATGRYELQQREETDDGWGSADEAPRLLRTTLTKETPRTIITYNRSPDIGFDRTINPYRGCEHGCTYCFARPSHSYHGLSAGLDFESRLFYKPDGPKLLERELARPRYVARPIALGMNTDAYQPVERKLRLTRRFLEILSAHNHPVTLLTKSSLIERDIDILAPMAEKGLVRAGVSITTLDPKLSRRLEPRAAAPRLRLKTVRALHQAGVFVSVMMAPIIPALNDDEIETLLETVADYNADAAGYVLLRLPHDLKDLFQEWLVQHYPDRATRIINLVRAMRGGKDYEADWGVRKRGRGEYARLISQRFRRVAKQFGLSNRPPRLRTDLFCVPASSQAQLSLDV